MFFERLQHGKNTKRKLLELHLLRARTGRNVFAAELRCYPVIRDKAYLGRLKKWDASISPAVHNLLRSQCKRAYKTERLKKDAATNKPLKATSRHYQKKTGPGTFLLQKSSTSTQQLVTANLHIAVYAHSRVQTGFSVVLL